MERSGAKTRRLSRLVTFNNDDRDAAFAAGKDNEMEKDAKWLREEEELLSFVLKRSEIRYINTGRTGTRTSFFFFSSFSISSFFPFNFHLFRCFPSSARWQLCSLGDAASIEALRYIIEIIFLKNSYFLNCMITQEKIRERNKGRVKESRQTGTRCVESE